MQGMYKDALIQLIWETPAADERAHGIRKLEQRAASQNKRQFQF
jgi:hypothetical protein